MAKKRETYRPKSSTNAREARPAGERSLVPTRGPKQFMVYTPTVESFQNKLADELLEWVLQPDTFSLKRFFHTKRMSYQDFKKRTADNPYCLAALAMAKEILADKVQDGWRTKIIDTQYAVAFLRQYDEDFRELALLFKAAGSQNPAGSASVQYIEVEAVPSSPLVKERSEN